MMLEEYHLLREFCYADFPFILSAPMLCVHVSSHELVLTLTENPQAPSE